MHYSVEKNDKLSLGVKSKKYQENNIQLSAISLVLTAVGVKLHIFVLGFSFFPIFWNFSVGTFFLGGSSGKGFGSGMSSLLDFSGWSMSGVSSVSGTSSVSGLSGVSGMSGLSGSGY